MVQFERPLGLKILSILNNFSGDEIKEQSVRTPENAASIGYR